MPCGVETIEGFLETSKNGDGTLQISTNGLPEHNVWILENNSDMGLNKVTLKRRLCLLFRLWQSRRTDRRTEFIRRMARPLDSLSARKSSHRSFQLVNSKLGNMDWKN